MTTASYTNTNTGTNPAILKTNALAITKKLDKLMFYRVVDSGPQIFLIQQVRLEYLRDGRIDHSITNLKVVTSSPVAKKIISELFKQAQEDWSCYGEILYCSHRVYHKPVIKIFMVLHHPHYYELVEVLQHLNSPDQDRTILHSAHLDLTDAISRAQYFYHLALLDGVI